MTGAPLLTVEGLQFSYPERPLFSNWSANILPGVNWVIGGDGTGKTTLLKLLAGDIVGRGKLRIGGISLDAQPEVYRRHFAWCDPCTDAFDQISPSSYFGRLHDASPGFDKDDLSRHIEGFGLSPHIAKPLYQLSTGSKRKVWLAGSLASGALLTLLDDPRAALDGPSVGHLMRTLEDCARHPTRAWVVADYELPVARAEGPVIELPD